MTDILGASPLGLPLSASRYLEADPEEFLALGNERQFPPREGAFELRITEELREVLYLDEARLVVVDHPAGTLVLPTSKLHPGKPFPPHELRTLRLLAPLKQANRSDGLDVTEALARTDGQMVSPRNACGAYRWDWRNCFPSPWTARCHGPTAGSGA